MQMTAFCAVLAVIFAVWCCSCETSVISGSLSHGCEIFDFSQPLEGWTITGNAFLNQPNFVSNGSSLGVTWIVDSRLERRSPCKTTQTSLRYAVKGNLTSSEFLIRSTSIGFVIAGGCDAQKVRVELLVNDMPITMVTGDCSDVIKPKTWTVSSAYLNKIAKVRLVDDDETTPNGYISLGKLHFNTPCQALPSCPINESRCRGNSMVSRGYSCHCPGETQTTPACGSNSNCTIPGGRCHQFCTNNVTGCMCKQCSCVSGHVFNAMSKSCDDIDECAKDSGGCQHACTNFPGGYKCACPIGHELNDDKKTCKDYNECQDKHLCTNAGCVNSQGSFECMCLNGYVKHSTNRTVCIDRDECAEDIGGRLCIQAQEVCVNTQGSYKCKCKTGYTRLGSQCADNNECSHSNGGCSHVCINEDGGYRCDCRVGYELSSDGKSCSDRNECRVNNGGCAQRCVNTEGSFACACAQGYSLADDNVSCIDINECDVTKPCQHDCVNSQGGYLCSCRHGYSLQRDNSSCLDINECLDHNGYCNQTCMNWEGGYNCSCAVGFVLMPDMRSCQDVDECSNTSLSNCTQLCSNTDGGYNCSCFEGFQLQPDGKTCQDKDECFELRNTSLSCEHECNNSPGGYNCSCFQGFVLSTDNRTCQDINECLSPDTCGQKCDNLIGSFSCSCHLGFELNQDGRTCEDVNECQADHGCEHHCTNHEGNFTCSCNHGYRLADDQRACVDEDECAGNHGCQEVCINTAGSYKCACPAGKVLTMDGKTCKELVVSSGEGRTGCDIVPLTEALGDANKDIKEAQTTTQLNYIARGVYDVLRVTGPLNMSSQEVQDTVAVMDNIANKMSLHRNGDEGTSADVVNELATNWVGIASRVLEHETLKSVEETSFEESSLTYSIPQKLEKMSDAAFHLLEDGKKKELKVSVSNKYIDMQLKVMKSSEFKGYDNMSLSSGGRITIPDSVLDRDSSDELIGVNLVVFKTLDSDGGPLKSDVITIQMINVDKERLKNLSEPVSLEFPHELLKGGVPLCGWINEAEALLDECDDLWSEQGCRVALSAPNYTVCECTHMTSYGLLMDVHGIYDDLSETEKDALQYISLVGCVISIMFCILCIVGFSLAMNRPMERKGRTETYMLHLNLVTAIGISQMFFVIGTFVVGSDVILCRVVSICTHYFLSASFCWMLVEGINVYNKIVKVFSTKKYSKYYFTLGWGVPVILVSITAGVAFEKYGPRKICWLSQDIIWVFAAPVLAVIVANSFVLLSIIYVLLRKTMNIKSGCKQDNETTKVRRSIKVSVILLPLLGITWVFGFLAADKNLIAFHFIFAIVNSLQGVFIFIAHCWINDSVKSAFLAKLPNFPMKTKYNIKNMRGGSRCSDRTTTESTFDTVNTTVTMPVHLAMSTVQLLRFGKSSSSSTETPATAVTCLDNDMYNFDNTLPNYAVTT